MEMYTKICQRLRPASDADLELPVNSVNIVNIKNKLTGKVRLLFCSFDIGENIVMYVLSWLVYSGGTATRHRTHGRTEYNGICTRVHPVHGTSSRYPISYPYSPIRDASGVPLLGPPLLSRGTRRADPGFAPPGILR